MKWFYLLPVLALPVLIGCSNNETPAGQPTANASPQASGTPVPSPSPSQGGSAWKNVSEKTSCEALIPSDCVGFYGFQVDSSGKYLVGPTQTGETVSGNVTPDELQTLSDDASSVLESDISGSFSCASGSGIPGMQDSVFVTPSGQGTVEVYRLADPPQGNNCYKGDPNAVYQLHSDLNQIMANYYPKPFPARTPLPSPSPSRY